MILALTVLVIDRAGDRHARVLAPDNVFNNHAAKRAYDSFRFCLYSFSFGSPTGMLRL